MVLLQLLTPDDKKRLLSVDKDAKFSLVWDLIAKKLERVTINGSVIDQVDGVGGDRKCYIYPDTVVGDLTRHGGAFFLLVRDPTEEEKQNDPAVIVGHSSQLLEGSGAGVGGENVEAREKKGGEAPAPAVQPEEVATPVAETVAPVASPVIESKPLSPSKPPTPVKQPAPSKSSTLLETTKVLKKQGPDHRELALSLSTEAYEVSVGKHRPLADAIEDKKYNLQYSNVRSKAPRVTTLSRDNSDNKAPACLRESYNWTEVGKYKAMAHPNAPLLKSKIGEFVSAEKCPRFQGLTPEQHLKKIFAKNMSERHMMKTFHANKAGATERRAKELAALVACLKGDPTATSRT